MKTFKIIIVTLFVFASISVFAQNYTVDTQQSKLKWFATKVTGKHNGIITLKSGEFTMKGDRIESGNFIIDMNSIVDEDLTDAGYNQKLVNHLKSDDFFGVATFPEARLVITQSTKFKDNKAIVKGNLTIKGKTNPVIFDAVKSDNNFQAKIVVDRSKFDVKYGSNSFFENLGDKAISDDFTLEVNLTVKQN
jgi:polyisoprenoid-binding protein YceI